MKNTLAIIASLAVILGYLVCALASIALPVVAVVWIIRNI